MYLGFSRDWQLRRFADSSSVIYNPFTGELHALSRLPTRLLVLLFAAEMTEAALCKTILEGHSLEYDAASLTTDTMQHLAALIELGVISTFAEQSSDSAVDPALFQN